MHHLANVDWDFPAPQVIWHIQPVRPITLTFQMNRRWSLSSLKMKNFSKYFLNYALSKVWMHASSVRAIFLTIWASPMGQITRKCNLQLIMLSTSRETQGSLQVSRQGRGRTQKRRSRAARQ